MSERSLELKVGVLVTFCVALLVAFLLLLGDFSMAPGSEIYLDVDTSAALKPGAPIKLAGVPAGKVSAVAYLGGAVDEKTGRPVFVRVTLRIDDDKLATLRRSARFYITTQGVLGEKYVEIEPSGLDADPLVAGEVVRGEPPLRLEVMAMNANRVLASLSNVLRDNESALADIIVNTSETMKSVRRVAERAEALMATGAPKVDRVLDELLAIEAEVERLAVSANAALGDGSELRAAVAHVSALSADAREALGPVVADVRRTLAKYGDVADAGREALQFVREAAGRSLERVDGILADVRALTAKVASGQGTLGALLADRETYDDIREMMKDLKRHPWKFIWKE